jgi:predicted transcriptional regulator
MSARKLASLSRRERQIMDVLYRKQRATVADVHAELSGGPSYSTVRAQLRVLEEKGHVRHQEQGLRYQYEPVVPPSAARRSALKHLVETFFQGSRERAAAALIGGEAARLSKTELDRLAQLIEQARAEDNG